MVSVKRNKVFLIAGDVLHQPKPADESVTFAAEERQRRRQL